MNQIFNLSTSELEQKVEQTAREIGVAEINYNKIHKYLSKLKKHDLDTYLHCLRVALIGVEVADKLNLKLKPLFLAGILHDIGKIAVREETLNAELFGKKEYDEVKIHPLAGYRILHQDFPFSANVLIRHHHFGKNPYPEQLPTEHINFSIETLEEIIKYSRLLALIDFYDAINTRDNNKFDCLTSTKDIILDENKDKEDIILELYDSGIFC